MLVYNGELSGTLSFAVEFWLDVASETDQFFGDLERSTIITENFRPQSLASHSTVSVGNRPTCARPNRLTFLFHLDRAEECLKNHLVMAIENELN